MLATASHGGTPAHLSVVRGLLAQAQLPETALQCPPDWPLDPAAREELIRAGEAKQRLFMNCSGKHAAMLLACATNGWPTDSYLDPQHPLQVRIRETVERLTGEKVVAHGGRRLRRTRLRDVARGARPRHPADRHARPTARRSRSTATRPSSGTRCSPNGWAIDGPGRANTVVIDRLGVFAKLGAEGVMVMAAPDGTTVALKVLDGSLRAASIVALRLLVDAGAVAAADVDALEPELDLAVLGGGVPVGAIRATYAPASDPHPRRRPGADATGPRGSGV